MMSFRAFVVGGLAAFLFAACQDSETPLEVDPGIAVDRAGVPEPAVVAIDVGGTTRRFWPFASANLQSEDDPINLVFAGQADPRNVRNALLALGGARGAPFPPVFPFDCTWSDAIGGLMGAFDGGLHWAGGAVQLQCGNYGPVRFHLRLFAFGDYTLGNAHFEVVIPGTADHQVLSWELAEQLVTYDLARTGLLGAAPGSTTTFTPAPTHRVIPAPIYNGLPSDLRTLVGGPPVPASDVGIANDGRATILILAGAAAPVGAFTSQRFTIDYDQVVPKPFCASGPGEFVLVRGPVTLEQDVSAGDGYRMTFNASGELSVVPVDPTTGLPTSSPLRAKVTEWQQTRLGDRRAQVKGRIEQMILPASAAGAGKLRIALNIGTEGPTRYRRDEKCSSK